MRTLHLSRLPLRGADIGELALLHAQWAVGQGPFEGLRAARLAAGMPAELTAEDIAGDMLKVSLPEPEGTTRTSVVRLSRQGGITMVEHMVVRQGAAYRGGPSAEAPEVVLALLADARLLADEVAGASLVRVSEPEVAPLVARMLAPERTIPIVLISVDNGSREPMVDPVELARRLAGMATVCFIDAVRSSHRLKEELVGAGFSDKFGCYNGGVRILWPGIVSGDDPYQHTLLLPVRLMSLPDRVRTEQVAGLFCEMITEDEDPRAWLRDADPAPSPPTPTRAREPARRTAARPVEPTPAREPDAPRRPHTEQPAPTLGPANALATAEGSEPQIATPQIVAPPVATPPPIAAVAPPIADVAPIVAPPISAPIEVVTTPSSAPSTAPRHENREASRPPSGSGPSAAANTWSSLAADVLAAFELATELERDLDATRLELVTARQALRRAEQQRDELAESATELADVARALQLAQARFSDRLAVLPSAHASALASAYRDPERCFRVLGLLAMFGQHDGTFADVLTKALGHAAEWKPKDSPQTIAKFGGQRTWTSVDGQRKLYSRHVTLGGSVSPQRCLQVYYDVLSDGRVEIAWVGEHRPTVGKDT